MFYKKNYLTSLIVALLAGCGGGGSTDSASPSGSSSIFTPGVYATTNYCSNGTQGTLIDGNDNLYEVCGTKLSVGKIAGKANSSSTGTGSVQFTVFDSGTPASTITIPFPSGPVEVPVPAGNPTVSTSATLSGTLLLTKGLVESFFLTDVDGPTYTVSFNSKWVGVSPVGSIMASYSTFSGNYLWFRPEKMSTDSTENLLISASGAISGKTSLGTITGQVSKFNSSTGVHDVSVTLTPQVGAPIVMAGVIGPYDVNMTGSSLNANYSGLLLAVRGSGAGFYKIFRHL